MKTSSDVYRRERREIHDPDFLSAPLSVLRGEKKSAPKEHFQPSIYPLRLLLTFFLHVFAS
ncbi:hypothetical protein CSA56_08170 [candidate division KSB3 bacterium]|uniref:Uncharacterized protein n=1 Tax=candidate division KSB3 bacterium TaxID=2044937 RepID=A0A2G6KHR4_9BACT|nr:MAG: hypothetical protein CSA56_08170 [candidate division KSB3 bacterium]